jgi:mycothiol synthase
MTISYRRYSSEDDFWAMRALLRDVSRLNRSHMWSWHVARLDYARWHICLNCAHVTLQDVAFLWDAENALIGFVMPDGGPGEAHLCVHPNWQIRAVERQMLDVAEQHLASTSPNGSCRLTVWAPHHYALRQQLLTSRGYRKADEPEYQWRRSLDTPIPEAPLASGYAIHPMGDGSELLERCYASGLAFHPDDISIADENRRDPTWYHNIQTAPLYRRDLDLVAVASDGAVGAFCTVWFDDVTRSAVFEPVATAPAHQRRGLARALMTEGLRRLQRMGCLTAFVSGYSEAANALYRSVMGSDYDLYEPWEREWAGGIH